MYRCICIFLFTVWINTHTNTRNWLAGFCPSTVCFQFIVVYTTVLHGKISIQLEIPLTTARRSCPSTTTRVAHSGWRMRFLFCIASWVAGKSLAFFSSSSNMFNANIFSTLCQLLHQALAALVWICMCHWRLGAEAINEVSRVLGCTVSFRV